MQQPPTIALPTSLAEITLGRWIAFMAEVGAEHDTALQALQDDKTIKDSRKTVLLSRWVVDRAYAVAAWWHDITPLQARNDYNVDEVMQVYNDSVFAHEWVNSPTFFSDKWRLPDAVLSPASPLTFGQFIDSKVLVQAAATEGQSKWELLPYLCAIYLHQADEQYSDKFVQDGSDRLAEMLDLPMSTAWAVMCFFDELNTFISEHFSVFADSGQDGLGSAHMAKHMEQWGWVNFLKTIAKTKVYDIAGSMLNSIDCARKALLYEVLIDASEERDHNLALSRDMENMYNR